MPPPATAPDSTCWVVHRGGLDGSTHGVLSSAWTAGVAVASGHTAVPATTATEAAARRRMRDVGRSIRVCVDFGRHAGPLHLETVKMRWGTTFPPIATAAIVVVVPRRYGGRRDLVRVLRRRPCTPSGRAPV